MCLKSRGSPLSLSKHIQAQTSSDLEQNRRTTERVRLEGTSGGHLVQPLCSSRATQRWLPKTVSRWLLNISRDSTTSLGNLCQCLVILTVKKWFLMFRSMLLDLFGTRQWQH